MSELFKLANIIATPLVIIVLPVLMFLYKYRHSDNKNIHFIKYSCTFDATHGLARQPLFWVAIVYPIGLFFFTGSYAWAGTNFDISATGFNQFIEISKLPLGLLALSLPLAVLTARLHGTKQTAMQIAKANEQIANTEKQILETQQKNRTDLYLAHYKHLSEHIIEIEKKWENASNQTVLMPGKSLTIDKKRCHRYLYPSSSLINGTGNISYRSFDYAVMTLVSILDKAIYLLETKCYNKKDFRDFFVNSSTLLDNMFNSLFFNESVESILYRRGTFPLENNEVCYFSTIEEVLSVSSFLEKSLHEVYSFDTDYEQKMNEEFKCKMTLLSNLMFDDAIRQIELYLNQEIHLFSKNPPDWSDLSNAFKQQDNGDKMAATISKG